jgi:hypothetical protein
MARRKSPQAGMPRTGDGKQAKGKKPSETGTLQMRSSDLPSGIQRRQPKGWGIARVIDIATGREKKK